MPAAEGAVAETGGEGGKDTERKLTLPTGEWSVDPEATVNLSGDMLIPLRDDAAEEALKAAGRNATLPTDVEATWNGQIPDMSASGETTIAIKGVDSAVPSTQDDVSAEADVASAVASDHLKGLLEALVFVSDHPIKAGELAKAAAAPVAQVKEALADLKAHYAGRGMQLEEVAGGWIFRTSPVFAPFVRDLTKQKPVKLTRAQIETLAILAYRQPITRPEIDDIRGVDSGPVLKILLERELVRILGKKEEPGRPLLYGTTPNFLEFFGLKSLKDLPTLKEFTELNEDSRRVVEQELGEVLNDAQPPGDTPAEDGGVDEPRAASTDPPSEAHPTFVDSLGGDGAANGEGTTTDDHDDDEMARDTLVPDQTPDEKPDNKDAN